jgi:thiosulfate/3-mercaptopyruvate sulfurtransferase
MSSYTTLITAAQLQQLLERKSPVRLFDCTSALMDPALADLQYAEQHIEGAVQAHLDRDLSAKPPAPAVNGGRHPLPPAEAVAQWLGRMGFDNRMQAVVYDRNGAHYCGRLWWMLKWLGHEAVAVLDGGLQAWVAAGGPISSGQAPRYPACTFTPGAPLLQLHTTASVHADLGQPQQTLIDARASARYRGDEEPLDPVAGHIPGALNRPFGSNFTAEGFFKPAAQLRAEFEALLAGRPAHTVVHHCGSGVSAIPNLLAMLVAGLGPTGLYAGSWSEWCTTPGMPCATGPR